MDAAESSLVHPTELKSPPEGTYIRCPRWGSPDYDIEPISFAESAFRHSGWAGRRKQTWDALLRVHTKNARLDRFANCGSSLWLECSSGGDDVRWRCNQCHDRWCIPCQTQRAARMSANISRLIIENQPRFLTLTLRHSATPLRDQIARLYACFNNFRRRESWRTNVNGGAAFLEVKLSAKDGLWHVHLHCLITGSYWKQTEIAEEWHAVTGDSFIVDVRRISGAEDAARYVCKYVTKPADQSVYRDTDKLDEMIVSLAGRRMCLTFGSWRGQKLDAVPEPAGEWRPIASLDTLLREAHEGDTTARRWLEAAARKWPSLSALWATAPP